MNTASTVYKRASSEVTTVRGGENPRPGGLFTTLAWIAAALASACNTEFNTNLTGMAVSVTLIDALVMMFATLLMVWGLENRYHGYIIPWLAVSTWELCGCRCKSVLRMWKLLHVTRTTALLPWTTFALQVLVFGLRLVLILRVLILTLNQWYDKKLEKEMGVDS